MESRKRFRKDEKKKTHEIPDAEAPSSDSDGPPEELSARKRDVEYQEIAKKEKNLPRKCPTPERMFRWTADDYANYDRYLLAKWPRVGCDENEAVYMSIKDQNCLLARTYRKLWNKKNNMW